MADLGTGVVTPQFQQRDPRWLLARALSEQGRDALSYPTPNGMAALAKALTIGLGGATNAFLANEENRKQSEDRQTMRDAAMAMQTGVKGWSDPDGKLAPIPAQKPGFDALLQVMSGNSRLAGQMLPLMVSRANALEERGIRKEERAEDRDWQGKRDERLFTHQSGLADRQIDATRSEGAATRTHQATLATQAQTHQTTLAQQQQAAAAAEAERTRAAQKEEAIATRTHQLQLADKQLSAAEARAEAEREFQRGEHALNREATVAAARIRAGADDPLNGKPIGSDPELAARLGVPVSDVDPFKGLDRKKAQDLAVRMRTAAEKDLNAGEDEMIAARNRQNDVKRFLALNEETATGGAYKIPGAQTVAGVFSSNLQEMSAITDKLTPGMRQPGSGATSDFDAKMFQNAVVGPTKDQETNKNVGTAMLLKDQNVIEYQQFRRDFFEANGHLQGAERAWRRYLEANPIFDPKAKEGSYALNPSRKSYREFFGQKVPPAGEKVAASGGGELADPLGIR